MVGSAFQNFANTIVFDQIIIVLLSYLDSEPLLPLCTLGVYMRANMAGVSVV